MRRHDGPHPSLQVVSSEMKLTEVIAVWDILHLKPMEDRWYCDLQDAIEEVVGIENDVPGTQWEKLDA